MRDRPRIRPRERLRERERERDARGDRFEVLPAFPRQRQRPRGDAVLNRLRERPGERLRDLDLDRDVDRARERGGDLRPRETLRDDDDARECTRVRGGLRLRLAGDGCGDPERPRRGPGEPKRRRGLGSRGRCVGGGAGRGGRPARRRWTSSSDSFTARGGSR